MRDNAGWMSSLADVFRVVNDMRAARLIIETAYTQSITAAVTSGDDIGLRIQ